MPADSSRRWIVLLNKAPRGPLTEAQVITLIQEGQLRPSDTAFEVPTSEGGGKATREWKLLWQFPEFDRRKEPNIKTSWSGTGTPTHGKKTAAPAPPVPPNRREGMTQEQAKQKARENLPSDLFDFSPEDLLARAHAVEPNILAESEGGRSRPSFQFKLPRTTGRWAVGGILLIGVTFGLLRMNQRTSGPPLADGAPAEIENVSGGEDATPVGRIPSQSPAAIKSGSASTSESAGLQSGAAQPTDSETTEEASAEARGSGSAENADEPNDPADAQPIDEQGDGAPPFFQENPLQEQEVSP